MVPICAALPGNCVTDCATAAPCECPTRSTVLAPVSRRTWSMNVASCCVDVALGASPPTEPLPGTWPNVKV
ncbi:Uncharacterised protein [Mycobacteroides abscessus subsp. abscessus]|nr:Uncharacterised protein [Mycobacteroides abscessus subsp. abscessus]